MVDFDSTINDFNKGVCRVVNEQFGLLLTPADFTQWAYGDILGKEAESWFWTGPYQDPDWTLSLEPMPGAILALNRLVDAGCYVEVVTSRNERHVPWVQEWLFRQRGSGIPVRGGAASKAWKVGERGFDHAIDDAPHHAEELADFCEVWLVDGPYNQGVVPRATHRYPIHRVKSLWIATERILAIHTESSANQFPQSNDRAAR
jgi:hypothetical protein